MWSSRAVDQRNGAGNPLVPSPSFTLGFASCAPNMQRWCQGGGKCICPKTRGRSCAPLMEGLGLGERPGAFKIKHDLSQMDVYREWMASNELRSREARWVTKAIADDRE